MKNSSSEKKTLILSIAGYDIDETNRMIQLAREALKHFDVLFVSYGCEYDYLFEREGFDLLRMEPHKEESRKIR